MFEIQEFYTDNFYPDLDLGNLFKVTSFTHESSLGYTWARIRLCLTFRHPQNGALIQVHVAYKTLLHVHVKYTLNK